MKFMIMNKNKNYLKNYDGIIKRLFFNWSEQKKGFEPFFYLICIRKQPVYSSEEEYRINIENERIKVQTYIKWFSSWASALKSCTPVSVSFSLVELDNIEKVFGEFFTNEKYTLFSLIDDTKRAILKKASGDGFHKLVSFNGVFRKMNRHVSVER